MSGTACPACGASAISPICRIDGIPVQSSVLLDSREEALSYPCADLALVFCRACGLAFNEIFDAAKVDYSTLGEESQHFSGTFSRFAERLVDELASGYSLAGEPVLEIGCGKGDFLSALVRRTGARAVGVDPGYIPGLTEVDGCDIEFRREYFSADTIPVEPALVVCRHTLEHIPRAAAFMGEIAELVSERPGTALFFETPDGARVLSEGAFWDIYYEHCSYFSLGSHARLFRNAGFGVSAQRLDYDGQYIIAHARWAEPTDPVEGEDDLGGLAALAEQAPQRIEAARETWRETLGACRRSGKRVAIWGGGSKAVGFLAAMGEASADVDTIIDINPRKQGRYLPGSGHKVDAPDALDAAPADTVIVMNPIYRGEIGAALAARGQHPELLTL